MAKPRRQEPIQEKEPNDPDSVTQLLLQVVRRLPPSMRFLSLALLLIVIGSFSVWNSLSDRQKDAVGEWVLEGARRKTHDTASTVSSPSSVPTHPAPTYHPSSLDSNTASGILLHAPGPPPEAISIPGVATVEVAVSALTPGRGRLVYALAPESPLIFDAGGKLTKEVVSEVQFSASPTRFRRALRVTTPDQSGALANSTASAADNIPAFSIHVFIFGSDSVAAAQATMIIPVKQ